MLQKIARQNEYVKKANPANWSISTKLLIAFFSVATIPMSLIAYNSIKLDINNLERGERHALENIAVGNASRLDQLIIDNHLTINQIARNLDVVEFLSANSQEREKLNSKINHNLDIISSSSPDYEAVFIVDAKGITQASTNPIFIGEDYSFRPYFKEAMQSPGIPSVNLLVGATSGRAGLFFAHSIRSATGESIGVAVLKINDSNILKTVNSMRVNSHVQSFVIDKVGVVIAHPNNLFLYRSLDKLSPVVQRKLARENTYGLEKIESLQLPKLAKAMIGATRKGHISYYSHIEQTEQIAGFSPLTSEPWILAVNKPKALAEAPIRAIIWKKTYFIVSVGGIAIVISLLLSRQLVKPIHALMRAEQALQQGNFEPEMLAKVSRSHDDLGKLACVFVQMAEEINNRERNLKSQVQDLRVEINETKKEREIAEITGTDYFKGLQAKAQQLKKQKGTRNEREETYFQTLNQKVKEQQKRFIANR